MILVNGCEGQLGQAVLRHLERGGAPCIGLDKASLDITDKEAVADVILRLQPRAVIHCAAYTQVDKAEREQEACFDVNAFGAQNVAQACAQIGAAMVYPSTDYVFDGAKEGPYQTCDAKNPLNVYGRSKALGEELVTQATAKHFIVRTSWLFGIKGSNFIKAMLRKADGDTVCVVDDQIGSPTYSCDLAPLLCAMVDSSHYGIYHATNEEYCSFADWAEKVFEFAGRKVTVTRIPSEDYLTPVRRPRNSRLSKSSLTEGGFSRLPVWQDALSRYILFDGGGHA